jgi:hypothetical protein
MVELQRPFRLDPDGSTPKSLRQVADGIHALGKVLDTGCQPLELLHQRDIGVMLKYFASWLHGFAAERE